MLRLPAAQCREFRQLNHVCVTQLVRDLLFKSFIRSKMKGGDLKILLSVVVVRWLCPDWLRVCLGAVLNEGQKGTQCSNLKLLNACHWSTTTLQFHTKAEVAKFSLSLSLFLNKSLMPYFLFTQGLYPDTKPLKNRNGEKKRYPLISWFVKFLKRLWTRVTFLLVLLFFISLPHWEAQMLY